MTKAIIYTRFSPRPGADESTSCEKQEEICREYCRKAGYEVTSEPLEFSDPDCSGDDSGRPGLWGAVDALRRGMVLVVRWRSRLARDLYLHLYIEEQAKKAGARIEAAEEDNGTSLEQEAMRKMLAVFREYEKKLTAVRTSRAMKRYQKERRRMSHRLPYGWMMDPEDPSRMVECLPEQEILQIMVEMREKGMSFRGIAVELDLLGYPPRSAEEWSHKTVAKILRRERQGD